MATKQVITFCNNLLQKQGYKKVSTDEQSTVDLNFFGINRVVNHYELMTMNETEQELHYQQDIMLLDVYISNKTKPVRLLRAEIITKSQDAILLTELLAQVV